MLKHRVLVAEFLNSNYEHFFKKYGELLQTRNYATLRQSLKLLSDQSSKSVPFPVFDFDLG